MLTKRIALALVVLLGCASSVPTKLPATSAASEAAQSAPVRNPGVALREDPPLPGATTSWVGLSGVSGDMGGMVMDDGGMNMPMGSMNMPMPMGKMDGMNMPTGNIDGGMNHHAH